MTASTASTTAFPNPETNVSGPLEIPPAPPSHPLRLRRVLDLLRSLRESEDQVAAGLEIFDAVGGAGGERTFQRFAKRPEGRVMLRSQPDLLALMADRDALATLPEGSLGRAYLKFAQEHGFAADGLVEKNRSVIRENDEIDAIRGWFWDRYTVAHDLWHVVTGCPPTPEGETTLLAFYAAQTPQRGYVVLLGLSSLGVGADWKSHWQHVKAYVAGHRAEPMLMARWEELLASPLEEVRRCFGVSELMQ